MDFKSLDRRKALGLTGAALAGVLVSNKAQATPSHTQASTPASPAVSPTDACRTTDEFSAPAPTFLVGLSAGRHKVTEVSPINHGGFSLRLDDGQGDSFSVDACAADDRHGALRGPGRTQYLELFLANKGDGGAPTHEAHGLAVMALAENLRHHEHAVPVAKMLPLSERIARYSEQLRCL